MSSCTESFDACMEVRLPHSPRAPSLARDALSAIRPHVPPDRYADLRLLVSELISNSVIHGGAGDEGVHLRVGVKEDVARVEVEDPGSGFDPVLEPASETAESGRGLAIVEALADRWGISSSHPTRVWFQMGMNQV